MIYINFLDYFFENSFNFLLLFLNKNIKNLEKEILILIIGNFEQIHKLGFLKNTNPYENGIKINPENNQIISNPNSNEKENISSEIKLKNFYVIILDIKYVKDIYKELEIKMTKKR